MVHHLGRRVDNAHVHALGHSVVEEDGVNALAEAAENADEFSENYTRAAVFRDKVLPAMEQLRKTVDELETNTSAELWPFPTYGDILFSVR